jgi:hypothetical protein
VRNDLSAILIGVCLLGAAWTVVLAVRDRPVSNRLLIVLAVAELLVLVQLLVAVIDVVGGDRPASVATFLAYAVSEVLIVPAGLFWSQAEKSR